MKTTQELLRCLYLLHGIRVAIMGNDTVGSESTVLQGPAHHKTGGSCHLALDQSLSEFLFSCMLKVPVFCYSASGLGCTLIRAFL